MSSSSSTGGVALSPAATEPRARPHGWREAPIQYGTAPDTRGWMVPVD